MERAGTLRDHEILHADLLLLHILHDEKMQRLQRIACDFSRTSALFKPAITNTTFRKKEKYEFFI